MPPRRHDDQKGVVRPIALLLTAVSFAAPGTARQSLDFNSGWRFHLGDTPFPPIATEQTYTSTKTGYASGAAAHFYDDTAWRLLDLPHDWVVEGPYDPAANGSQGYRPRGIAWYRKTFRLPPDWRGQHLELQFDGVATHCTVWINGIEMHRNLGGYTGLPPPRHRARLETQPTLRRLPRRQRQGPHRRRRPALLAMGRGPRPDRATRGQLVSVARLFPPLPATPDP